MKITSHTQVEPRLAKDIRALESKLKTHDGIDSEMYIADNLNFDTTLPWVFTMHKDEELIAAVVSFIPAKKEIELMAVTHPDYRRKGYFSMLENRLCETWEKHKIPSLLYVLNEDSETGKAVAQRRGASYQYTEYLMELRGQNFLEVNGKLEIMKAKADQVDTLANIQERAFGLPGEDARTFISAALKKSNHHMFLSYYQGSPIGMGAIAVDEEASSIYGVCVLPEHQGFGYGKEIMVHLIKEATRLSNKKVTLEVDSKNERAYQMYRKLGFVATKSTGYYQKALQQ
ncbi:GNAT family N-acetyltransferase [Thalassobacillus devorans]|uniref:GNAT family N-acetyltransferase n=1 Tax=Thalassobacillus devorans TaxID=279813 RepID=UPI00048BF603|nr:GNAT family N-acetyltransferase [Thalassobacillus devorans]